MADVQIVYETPDPPPVRAIHLVLTSTEAEALALTASRIAGPFGSNELTINQPSEDCARWNPAGLSLTEVRDVLRTIGNAIVTAGGSKRKP